MWLILVKNTATGETKIWESEHRWHVVRYFMEWNAKKMKLPAWSKEADEYILEHYHRLTAYQIAMYLSNKEGRRISKNAVIGRRRDLMALSRKLERERV